MFLFRKAEPAVTPQEQREELLREFFMGNLEYKVKFDQTDLRKREHFLKKIISGGWLGVGVAGMGYVNFRLASNRYPELRNARWGILAAFVAAGGGLMVSNYFKIKLDVQEYLRQKYLAGTKTGDSGMPRDPQ